MPSAAPDTRPGFRRRIVVHARQGAVAAMLEDDIHCLAVVLRHEGGRVSAVAPDFVRAPWTTCPGAVDKLVDTFVGKLLSEVTARADKKQNCTHLHDMAVLAAAHAGDDGETVYDILATDPNAGERRLELRRQGELVHDWTEQDGRLTAPPELAGQSLFTLRDWIGGLTGSAQEAARLLQWAAIVAHGRTMPMERQSNAQAMPPNCYTFQPDRAIHARQIGDRRDFSDGTLVPLGGLRERIVSLF